MSSMSGSTSTSVGGSMATRSSSSSPSATPSPSWRSEPGGSGSPPPKGGGDGEAANGLGMLVIIGLIVLATLASPASGTNGPATLTPTPPVRPLQGTTSAAPQAPVGQAEIVSVGLIVRSGPGLKHPVIDTTTLVRGMRVPVLAIDPDTGWLRVRLPDGREGWISGAPDYVKIWKIQYESSR